MTRVLVVGRVVAVVVLSPTQAYIVASHQCQLLAPLHHNQARSSWQSHILAVAQALAVLVVRLKNIIRVVGQIH